MVKVAAVDLRRRQLITYSSSRSKDGLWVGNGAFEILDADAGDSALGEAVLRMLRASKHGGVRTPDLRRGPSPFAPVLAAVGLRSYAAYARGTRHVEVEGEDPSIKVTPSRNGGSREGFVGMPEDSVLLWSPNAEAVGAAVRAVLARST